MGEELRLQGYREPSGLWTRRVPAPAAHPDLRAFQIEFSSRGDRVAGRLWMPRREGGEHPLVLLQHGAGGSSASEYLDAAAGPWVERGAAVASVDFPLHGTRGDQKLSTLLNASLLGDDAGPLAGLAVEFARQAVIDLERALDALCEVDGIDAERIAYAGFSMGAMLGACFCGLDPRPRAAALALGGAGLAPDGIDPAGYIGRFAPRPLLLVNAERDATVPRDAAQALYRAARPPVEQLWFDADHDALPGVALKAMWEFLAPQLDLA
ncbi:MAG: alpha/beta hydrolase family protein [Myxococcota bacterium]